MAKKSKPLIFVNDVVTELCLQFKTNRDLVTYRKICEGSNNLMDSIIRSNRFHLQVPFGDIKNHLFLQVENWIEKWNPEKGKVYTYFSTCIKHACLSFVSKESLVRQRFVFEHQLHGVPLESVAGTVGPNTYSEEFRASLTSALEDLDVRWREPVIRDIVRYLVCCVVHNRTDGRRQEILRTVTFGYPVDLNTAKFLLDWTQAAVRACLLQKYDQPLGEIDIIRVAERFDRMTDIVKLVGLRNAKIMMATFAGQTIRFPSQTQLRRHQVLKRVHDKLNDDPSPDAVQELAREVRTTPEKIEEYYERVHSNIQAGLLDDSPLFDRDEVPELTSSAFRS